MRSNLQIVAIGILFTTACLHAQTPDAPAQPLPPNVSVFTVTTTSEENRHIPFYVRIPAGYDSTQDGPFRILIECPFLNQDATKVITGRAGNQELLEIADQRKWFVIAPTFKTTDSHNRETCYYYPKNFSGQAVLDALDQIAQRYPVDTHHILVQGLSGGAQFMHRFALWAPDRVVAAAINSCSWFDDPPPSCSKVAWLVTIGDSDPSFENSLDFIAKLHDAGATPLFRSYIGMVHEGDGRVTHLGAEFLKYYDDLTRNQLGKSTDEFQTATPLAMQGKDMPFIGDNQTWKYVPNTEANLNLISEDSRVYLPSKTIADTWGTPQK